MTVTEALDLALRRDELVTLVAELTEERKQETPDGERAVVPPLLVQVDQDVRLASAGEAFRATTLPSTRSVTSMSALELLVEIDRTVGVRPGLDRLDAVRAWAARVGGSPVLGEVADAAGVAGRWVTLAEGLLAPMRRSIGLRGAACPSCGAVRTLAANGSDERTVEAALQVDTRTGRAACTAAECGAWWSAELLPHLAAVLDQQQCEILGTGRR